MRNYLPKQNNLLLTLFVGDFNVVLPRKEDKIKLVPNFRPHDRI